MQSTCEFIEQPLKLRGQPPQVGGRPGDEPDPPGVGFFKRRGEIKVRIDSKARKRAKDRLRKITSRSWGISMERRINSINRFSRGWTAYFSLADTPSPFEQLDEWLRRRLRQVRWKEWKKIRTKHRSLVANGIPDGKAYEWPAAAGVTGGSRGRGFSPAASPTPTGASRDCSDQRSLPPFPGCDANRRMRTRMSGGVGGAG
jgi:RNA-directed DNA polymerase